MLPGILKILGQGDIAAYCIPSGMYLGWRVVLPRILKILGRGGRGVWLHTAYHPGMYLGRHVLPGILKILGQGGMAAYCIPSRDVLGIVCVTRGFSRYSNRGYGCVLYHPGCIWASLWNL